MQTFFYPGTETPMLIIQDDGSIYHFNANGKHTMKVENSRFCIIDGSENENVVAEFTHNENEAPLITLGNPATAGIVINMAESKIELYGAVTSHGSFNSL